MESDCGYVNSLSLKKRAGEGASNFSGKSMTHFDLWTNSNEILGPNV